MISSVFIHRPRLAIVISIVISIAGVIALGALPVAQFPDIVPPQVRVSADLSRRLGRRRRRKRRPGHRSPGQRRRQDDLYEVDLRRRRQLHPQCDLRRSVATPTSTRSMSPTGSTRRWRNCRPRSSATASRPRSIDLAIAGRRDLLAQGQPRRAVPVELRQDQHGRHPEAGDRASAMPSVGRSRIFDADLAQPGPHGEPRHHAPRMSSTRSTRRTPRPRSAASGRRLSSPRWNSSSTSARRGG